MNTTKRRFLVPAAVAALLLSGTTACGSGAPKPSTAPTKIPQPMVLPTVSKAAFAAAADALCKTTNATIEAKFKAVGAKPNPAAMNEAYATVLRESYKLPGALLALGAPTGQQKELITLAVELYRATAGAEQQGQQAFFADNSDPWKPAANKLEKDFGLPDCGQQN